MTGRPPWRPVRRAWDLPEVRVALLSLALNGAWEFLQSPLYADRSRGVIYVVKTRLHCAAGDVLLSLFAFLVTALLFSSRQWPWERRSLSRVLFLLLGVSYTIWSEWFHTRVALSWTYAASMPRLLGIGVAPIAQWIVTPMAVLWFLRRFPIAGIPLSGARRGKR